MEIVIGVVGFFVGLFAWSQIVFPLVLVMPRAVAAKKQNKIQSTYFIRVLTPVLISSVVLFVSSYLSRELLIFSLPAFLTGSLIALVMVLFNIKNKENKKDMLKAYPEL